MNDRLVHHAEILALRWGPSACVTGPSRTGLRLDRLPALPTGSTQTWAGNLQPALTGTSWLDK